MSFQSYKKFNYYFIIYLIFISIFCIVALYKKHTVGNDSTISEWLINYQGGFSRRGLVGEVFIILALKFDIKIRFLIFLFQSFVYLLYIILSYNFFKKIEKNFITVIAIFSPLLLIYHMAEIETLARKEVLLFIHFMFLFLIKKLNGKLLYLFSTLPLLMLIWEPIIFFIGFYFLIILSEIPKKLTINIIFKIFSSFFPMLLVFVILITNNYTTANETIMCNNLKMLVNENCYMSLGYVDTSIGENFNNLFREIQATHIARYLLALAIGFAPLITIIVNSKIADVHNKNLLFPIKPSVLFAVCSLPVLVLFAMGLDWGRWSNIFYFYSISSIFYLINNKFLQMNLSNMLNKIKKLFNYKKIFTIIFFISFAFTWNLKTLFKEDIGSLPIYRLPAKTIKSFFSS